MDDPNECKFGFLLGFWRIFYVGTQQARTLVEVNKKGEKKAEGERESS